MSSKKAICVAITARPSYSRIRSALTALKTDPGIDLTVLCSGSALLDRYGRVVDLIKADGFNVTEELYTFVEGNEPVNMALTTAATVHQTASALRRFAPDFVITIADRYETIGTAISAAYLGIPLIHIQGGEVTGNIDERVRHAVTKLSDFHIVANAKSAKRLLRMGEDPRTVFNTGCPSIDIAREARELSLEQVQEAISRIGVGMPINLFDDYLVVLQHPETDTYDDAAAQMQATLDVLYAVKMPALVFWPNVDAGSDATSKCIRINREAGRLDRVHILRNLEGHIFLRLLMSAKVLLGNSSAGLRECAYLGVPVVNIGSRQYGRDRAENVVDAPYDSAGIEAAVRQQIAHGPYSSSDLFGSGDAGTEIARVVAGLTKTKRGKSFYET